MFGWFPPPQQNSPEVGQQLQQQQQQQEGKSTSMPPPPQQQTQLLHLQSISTSENPLTSSTPLHGMTSQSYHTLLSTPSEYQALPMSASSIPIGSSTNLSSLQQQQQLPQLQQLVEGGREGGNLGGREGGGLSCSEGGRGEASAASLQSLSSFIQSLSSFNDGDDAANNKRKRQGVEYEELRRGGSGIVETGGLGHALGGRMGLIETGSKIEWSSASLLESGDSGSACGGLPRSGGWGGGSGGGVGDVGGWVGGGGGGGGGGWMRGVMEGREGGKRGAHAPGGTKRGKILKHSQACSECVRNKVRCDGQVLSLLSLLVHKYKY